MKGLIISIAAVTLLLTTAIAGYSLTSNDGSTIYATDCTPCHAAMNSLTLGDKVLSANAVQITTAFNHYTAMSHAILRTNTSVLLGAVNHKLTSAQINAVNARLALNKPPLSYTPGMLQAKQKNAIVAALQIQDGEDFYTAKYDPNDTVKSTWNCSTAIMCHGPYDNSNISGMTYGEIVKSFNKKKSTMAPLKSKYKLSELHLIAKALAVAPPFSGGGTTSVDGATLYYMDCMPCHNGPIDQSVANDSSISAVATAGSPSAGANLIQTAISTNAGAGTTLGGMGTQVLTNLSPTDIQAVAVAIQTNQLPADLSIYSSASCFGTGTGPTNHCHQGSQNPPYPN